MTTFVFDGSNLPPLKSPPVSYLVKKGTNGADTITADAIGSVIYGYGGNDYLDGAGGNDFIYGGSGNDNTYGWGGDDEIFGESGNDVLNGASGNDRVDGGTGHDIVSGGIGNDIVIGGDGFDTVKGDAGDDILFAGKDAYDNSALYNDTLEGGSGNDSLWGTNGVDTQYGGSGNDSLFGHGGSDKLYDGTGIDKLVGGDGNDAMTAENDGIGYLTGETSHQTDRFYGGAGTDYIILKNGAAGSFDIIGEVEILRAGAKGKIGPSSFETAYEVFWEDTNGQWQRDFIAKDVEAVLIGGQLIWL